MAQSLPHKLAAIFYADVAGYSRLTGEDEEGTHRILSSYLDALSATIKRHGGKVLHYAGDALLADFATVSQALNCAVAVQHELKTRNAAMPEARRVEFRIGVNLGEVIVDRSEVYGNGVNVAARLQTLAEPGGICVSGSVVDAIGTKLPLSYEYLGEQSVKNIEKPVRAYRVVFDEQAAQRAAGQAMPATQNRRRYVALAALAFFTVAGSSVALWRYSVRHESAPAQAMVIAAPALALPDKPSIAVLPFVNMSGDKEQEYFSDGMTEDVITSLSKLSGLFVIARNSVFTYKGRAVKPEQVSRELGVRYVLEGSVRKAENRVRITAQLIDATKGHHLWAEKYDGELKDIFALQDNITGQIVAALAPKLTAGEESRSKRQETSSIEAYDHVLRGVALFYEFRKESMAMARQMFERAVALDPNYAKAYVWLSWTYFDDWEFQWTEGPGALDRSLEAARRAVALDDSLSDAHTVLGWLLLWKKQHDVAIAELERAVSLDPNYERAYGYLGETLNFAGRSDEAIGFAKKAMRLDPNNPVWPFMLAHSYFLPRRYDEAITAMQDSLRRGQNFLPAHRMLAVVYAELGREKEAQAEAAQILRISPGASLDLWRERLPYKNQGDLERFIAGLRKAGLK
jgi:adenylate cyclase